MSSIKKAIVAAGHPVVTQAAMETLENGGNAFDAAIAAGFAGAVAEPALTSLGGGGFLLARTTQGKEILFDFFSDTPGRGLPDTLLEPHFFPVTVHFPGSDQDFNIGMGSVAVPGNLKGYIHVHNRLGRLPLAEVVAPTVRAAREGVCFNFHQAYFMGLLKPIMTLSDAGRALYEKSGQYIVEGDRVTNPALADFIDNLTYDAERSFYQGDIAERIADDMRHGQGMLTTEDLASYEVIERSPLEVLYRGRRLLTNPPPSFGGSLIASALSLLEQLTLSCIPWGSPGYLLAHALAMQEVDRHRLAGIDATDTCLSEWKAETMRTIRTFSRGTTHVSVIDTEGNVASMTTSNGEGSGYIVPGTGVMLNNMMGEDDLHPDGFHSSPPGQRIASMMSPSVVMSNEAVEFVLGSGGSKRIRTAITQVISNIVDFGMEIEQAVKSPRVYWDGETLQVEPGISDKTVDAIRSVMPVNQWEAIDIYFGGVNAVSTAAGVGDPRRGGDSITAELTGRV